MKFILFSLVVVFSVAILSPVTYALVVNHKAVLEFDQIPDYWLEKAKELTIHFGHTSHGSQILSGLVFLGDRDPKYRVNIQSEENAQVNICHNRQDNAVEPSVRKITSVASGNGSTLRITEEGSWPCGYWSTPDAIEGTDQLLDYNGGMYDVSGWSWCGQVSSCPSYLNCDEVPGERHQQFIDDYLNEMSSFETKHPDVSFFYMTGHSVGCSPENCPAYERIHDNNDRIREYAINNDKVLFDFADIESWDLNGNYHPNTSESCEWCTNWCDAPFNSFDIECQYKSSLPRNSNYGCGDVDSCRSICAHSHGINCVIKGKAFWWMLARLAGWEGVGESDPPEANMTVPSMLLLLH